MFLRRIVCLHLVALAFAACDQEPVLAPSTPVPPELIHDAVHRPSPSPVPPSKAEPVLAPPLAPELTVHGHRLILEFETGGRSGYDPHPEWPKGASGVTVGIGYDCGYASKAVIRRDWSMVEERERLAATAGITGQRAAAIVKTLHDIMVEWEDALFVFDKIDVAREFARCRHAYPGFDELRPNAQAALISLGFNRGYAMAGANRAEMRNIRDNGVPNQDYTYIAKQFRQMIRVWVGTSIERGMRRRRNAEADLVLKA